MLASNFAGARLRIGGLVDNPVDLSLEELRALPHQEQITQHFCIQGWSGVAKWGGVSLQTILDRVRPKPEAKWVVFYSFADGPEGGIYSDVHAIEQMRYKLTMLAYDMIMRVNPAMKVIMFTAMHDPSAGQAFATLVAPDTQQDRRR